MATLWQHLRGRTAGAREVSRYSFSEWANDRLDAFQFGGRFYPLTGIGYAGTKAEQIEHSYVGYVRSAYKANGIVFACSLLRQMVFSEARFQFQQLRDGGTGRPGKLFGNQDLDVLENPWPNGTTGELLSRALQDADFGGNFFAVREPSRIRRLRPDWVTIVLTAPPEEAVESDVAGYAYQPGGFGSRAQPEFYLPHEVCHWSPIPDPEAQYRGMSWLTPVVREIQADGAATTHKLKFFENGATPSIVASFKDTVADDDFEAFVEEFKSSSVGLANAYKPLFLAGGADVTVVGADLRQLDFKATQGAGETRIAAAARVHPVLVGLSEGLSGSSLNAGNFSAARRSMADGTMRPLWRSACAAFSTLVDVPPAARLWIDDRDIPFLREDQKDAAEIQQMKASTITMYVREGYTPESSQAAVDADDRSLLVHTGLLSVQLQPPGVQQADGSGVDPKAPAELPPAQATRAEFDDDAEDAPLDEPTLALVVALAELSGTDVARAFDPTKHARNPKGSAGGGRFRSMVDRIKDAIAEHRDGGSGDPLAGFDREQLRQAAKKLGIPLRRGEDRDSIAEKLLADLRTDKAGDAPDALEKAPAKAAKPVSTAAAAVKGKPASIRVAGKDRLDEIVGDAKENRADVRTRNQANYATPYDTHLQHIATKQGFDAKPQTGTKEDLDKAIASGWTEVWRGIRGDQTEEINDRLRRGVFEPGHGMYGNGVYTSTRRESAERYRYPFDRDQNSGRRPDYESLPNAGGAEPPADSLLRIAIDPSARVANWEDISAEYGEWLKTVKPGSAERLTLNDPGRYAAARGYDVLLVKGQDDGGFYPPGPGEAPWADQPIVLNRSVMMIQRAEDAP